MPPIFDPIQVVQLTDIHLCDNPTQSLLGVIPEQTFDRVMGAVRRSVVPDLLLFTGDLTQEGGESAYRRLQEKIVGLNLPAYYLPGNHDNITHMQTWLGSDRVLLNRSVILGKWHLVLLNSAIPGKVEGYLDDRCLTWLNHVLQSHPALPTLIALHHPVLPLGCPWLDRIGLTNAQEFWRICGSYAQVKGVIAGHAHQEQEVFRFTRAGMIRCMVTPSTCAQFKAGALEFQTDDELPGYRTLKLFQNGNLESAIHRVPQAV